MAGLSEIPDVYRKHFHDKRRERVFVSSLGFFLSFGAARGVAHAIKHKWGPFKNVSAGGTHIHHSFWGILSLLGVGYAWLLELGTDEKSRVALRTTAFLYGAGSALTLDEFSLWLEMKDDYWNKEGRKSIDAVALFGALMFLSAAGGPFWGEVSGLSGKKGQAGE